MNRIADQTAGGSDQDEFWWCLRHERVEQGAPCPENCLGPFASREEAEQALEAARNRTREWDEADRRWDEGD